MPNASLAPVIRQRFFDANGDPLAGGKLYTYVAGSARAVNKPTYTDNTMGFANTNPVILDADGYANLWLSDNGAYLFVLNDSLDNTVYTVDNVPGGLLTSLSSALGFAFSQIVLWVPNRASLAAILAPVAGQVIMLGEGLRAGPFIWTTGDQSAKVANDPQQAFYVASTFVASNLGAWVRIDRTFKPEYYGAIGDGLLTDGVTLNLNPTNDTLAFKAMGIAVTAAKGGVVSCRNVMYIVGLQVFAGATGLGYSYQASDIFKVTGVNGLKFNGNGCQFRIANGMRYGSFDPVTGNPTGTQSTTNYRADVKTPVDLSGYDISIENFIVDGNSGNMIIGGQYSGPGIQIEADGFRAFNVSQFTANNIKTINCGRDGAYISGNGKLQYASPPDNITVTSHYSAGNGRQAMSLLGGRALEFNNCAYKDSGQGAVNSSPAAGVDIEPNGSDWVSEITFNDCDFENNSQNGLVTGGGNSHTLHINNCVFWQGFAAGDNTKGSGDALWITVPPNTVIKNCLIHGCISNMRGDAILEDCTIDNISHPTYGQSAQNRGYQLNSAQGYYLRCKINTTGTSGMSSVFSKSPQTFDSCVFNYQDTGLIGGARAAVFTADCINCTWNDTLPAGSGYYQTGGANAFYGRCIDNGPGIAFGSAGATLNINVVSPFFQNIMFGEDDANPRRMYSKTSIPTSGTYSLGDIVFYKTPVAGGFIGAVCTVAGTPGTWKTFGVISA